MGKIRERALEFYSQGNGCGQSVAMACAEEMGLKVEQAQRLTNGYGGGVGGQGEICGAMNAAAMVIGARTGLTKAEAYKKIKEAGNAFKQTFNGHIRCQELMKEDRVGLYGMTRTNEDDVRWAELFAKRPCASCVARAAECLEKC